MAVKHMWDKYETSFSWSSERILQTGGGSHDLTVKNISKYSKPPSWVPARGRYSFDFSDKTDSLDLPFYTEGDSTNKETGYRKYHTYDEDQGTMPWVFASIYRNKIYEKEDYIGEVYSDNEKTYPKDGVLEDFWYVYKGIANNPPELDDNTKQNEVLQEGWTLTLNGRATDETDDIITLYYQVGNYARQPLATGITSASYRKSLVFKDGYLYDKTKQVSNKLNDNTKYAIKIWAVDQDDAKSEEVLVTFTVINNRPPILSIDSFKTVDKLVESSSVEVTGKVSDLDKDTTTLFYNINGGDFIYHNKGGDRSFRINIPLKQLNTKDNKIVVRAVDQKNTKTEKTIILNKTGETKPLKTSFIEYKMNPPKGKSKGLLLWVQRSKTNLTTKVSVKFGENEFKEIKPEYSASVDEDLIEDEYVYEHPTEEREVYLRIEAERNHTSIDSIIKNIKGVFE